MSHFTVLIIGGDPEKQLAPFQENNMGDCPKEYLAFVDKEDEYRKEYSESADHQRSFPTFDAFMETYAGYNKDAETGRYGYWENPNKKWDWYQLGGRWTGAFKLKPGRSGVFGSPGLGARKPKDGYVDQARKGDIDFEAMAKESLEEGERLWVESEKAEDAMRYWQYGRKKDDTREAYLARHGHFTTFAVLKDGKWHERGSMGWWGTVSNEQPQEKWDEEFQKLLTDLPDDTLLSVYDCHI